MAEESILTDSINQSNSRTPIHVPFIYNDTNFDWLARNAYPEEAGATGPFCNVYQTETEWKLLGGTVTGGGGTETIDAITIGNIETPPADGTFYWLVCNMTANEEDGVLLPGGNLTSATTGSGSSVPDNNMPEIGSLSGQLNISLGEWMGGVFTPAGCGNIQIFHCPATLSYSRG